MTTSLRPCATGVFAVLLSATLAAGQTSPASPQPTSASEAASAGVRSATQVTPNEPLPDNVRRPYRGLFAPPADPSVSTQSLDVTFNLSGAYDDDSYANDATDVSLYRQSGWYAGASAGLAYSRPGERLAFAAGGDAGLNWYDTRDDMLGAYRARAALSVAAARRTRVRAAQSFAYAPEYRLALFGAPLTLPGALDPFGAVVPDLDLYRLRNYRTGSELSLTQGVGRRSSLEAAYALLVADYTDDRFDYRAQSGGGRFLHQLTRHANVRLGYFYNVAGYLQRGTARDQRVHNIDAGIDYGRALSFSRRTSVAFSTGSAVLVRDDLSRPQANSDLVYHLIGSAHVRHEIARTWTAQAGYRRGVDFHEGFNDPFAVDAVNGSIAGFASRRVRLGAAADYARGTIGIDTSNRFESLSATAGLEYALSRNYAVYGRYLYYRYDFDNDVALDPRFLRALHRQGARFGLTASFPLVR